MKSRFFFQNNKRCWQCTLVLLLCMGMLFSCASPNPAPSETGASKNTEEGGDSVTEADKNNLGQTENTTADGVDSTTAPEENNPSTPPVSQKIKIACVGDSLTCSGGLTNPTSYPLVLQRLLGTENYLVKNFGAPGRTMTLGLSDSTFSDRSYADTPLYRESLSFCPDIVILCFGTNDTWKVDLTTKAGKDGYVEGLTYLINSYKAIGVDQIYVCLPPYAKSASIGPKVRDLVIPMVLENAEALGYQTIDFYTPTDGKDDWFRDNDDVHFDPIGYEALAKAAYQTLTNIDVPPPAPAPTSVLPYDSEGFGDVFLWD